MRGATGHVAVAVATPLDEMRYRRQHDVHGAQTVGGLLAGNDQDAEGRGGGRAHIKTLAWFREDKL
jgi:hypothetical protein